MNNNIKNTLILNINKYYHYIIGIIVILIILLMLFGINSYKNYKTSLKKYIFDGSVYNEENFNIKYDNNNNIVYFDSSDKDEYNITYNYLYDDTKISKISFEGSYFSSEIKGEFSFEYNGGNINIIKLVRIYRDVENVDYYVFHYDENNRVIRVDHDKGGVWNSNDKSPYGCNYYYYDKYVISDCQNTELYQPNLNEVYFTDYYKRSIYAPDENIQKNKNLWIANNISPFIYYGINFPRDISSDVSLLGSSYDVAYNPGKLLYSTQKKYSRSTNKTDIFSSKLYYSNGNIIKAEYGEKLDFWGITIFKDDKRVSYIDNMNKNYEFLYSYNNNNIIEQKKPKNHSSSLIGKYNDYFKSSKLDYDIENIIKKLDNIIQEQEANRKPEPNINTLLENETNSNKQKVDYDFEFTNTDTVSITFNGEEIIGKNIRDSNCRIIRNNSDNHYTCQFILKEGTNNIVVIAENSDNKKTTKNYTINFNVIEPSIKFENNYYKVAINDNQWHPKFILSDNIDYYEVTWYFDEKVWNKSETFNFIEKIDNGLLYNVWISGIIIGTKPAEPGIHKMKVEIKDKRTGKIASDEVTIECY